MPHPASTRDLEAASALASAQTFIESEAEFAGVLSASVVVAGRPLLEVSHAARQLSRRIAPDAWLAMDEESRTLALRLLTRPMPPKNSGR